MDNEPFQLRSPDSPFQVAVILKKIFSELEFSDLASCRQVSKLWDCEASKQLWKVSSIRPISWDWTTGDENDLNGALAAGREITVSLANSNVILDMFRSRVPSSKDSLVSVKINPPFDSLLGRNRNFCLSHYHDVGRTIHGFLTDPTLCNILASIELELFADLDVVLRLLSEVPNLREFTWRFDAQTFVTSQSVVPIWHKTSPVQKLKLNLYIGKSDDLTTWQQKKFGACVGVLLGGCVNLKNLDFADYTGALFRVIDAKFFDASLKNPELVEALTLQSFDTNEVSTPPEKIQLFSHFSKITHLYLLGSGPFSLESWKSIMTNNYLPPSLERFTFTVYDPYDDDGADFPKKLIYDHLVDAGLGRLQRLTWLELDLCRVTQEVKYGGKWAEEWEFVEESFALVRAKIPFDRQSIIHLRPHKHLRELTLSTRRLACKVSLESVYHLIFQESI